MFRLILAMSKRPLLVVLQHEATDLRDRREKTYGRAVWTLSKHLHTILHSQHEASEPYPNTDMWKRAWSQIICLPCTRALEFLLAFINSILQDHSDGVEKENLRHNILQAYESTLKRYHGKMTQFVFSNIARLVPHRTDFLKTMMTESDATLEMVFVDLGLYLPNFKSNICAVNDMLVAHGLDEQKVV
ncbi:glycolipid transfer protein [Elysia marginata]|uniref:Glycolipid transfer protein n=1 Tax=Elysia marginata TaxID=1093978 RepID=A0AAV4HT18_9GAST|nr:glycolipid transfer protein [Elysia marginata]